MYRKDLHYMSGKEDIKINQPYMVDEDWDEEIEDFLFSNIPSLNAAARGNLYAKVRKQLNVERQETNLWDEADTLERARQGDQNAFAEIYQHFSSSLFNFIYRLMGDTEDASDILQDVFLKAYMNLPKTSGTLNLTAWLHRVASNACLNVLRHRRIVHRTPWDSTKYANITPASENDEPERHAVSEETRLQVKAVLNQMNERYRLCLILRDYQELSMEEIADLMGTSRATVKSLLFSARDQFREIYESTGLKKTDPIEIVSIEEVGRIEEEDLIEEAGLIEKDLIEEVGLIEEEGSNKPILLKLISDEKIKEMLQLALAS